MPAEIKMRCSCLPSLPKLGWIARLDPVRGKLEVYHGTSVECGDRWVVEGVWGEDFAEGEFHKSESFFGSGIRIEGNQVYFVPSSTTIDRIFWCRSDGEILVSNSLILLLAVTGATLDEGHDYHRESLSILRGLQGYRREFSIVHPTISEFYQVFMENMVVSAQGVQYQSRFRLHRIRSFDEYYGLLTETLRGIKRNYEHPARKAPVSTFTTMSSGYDSTAVTCLAKDLGVRDCFTAREAYSMIPRWLPGGYAVDDGTRAARQLGMRIHYLESPRKIRAIDELHFLATPYPKNSGIVLNEAVFQSMATHIERSCAAAAVFLGHHGDGVWSIDIEGELLRPDIVREINSGLNLAEIRLKAGFFSVAVPFLFAINIADIVEVGASPEMAPWRLNNGYDRPIARRIAESAGVSRDAFGQWKKSVCNYYRYPNNPTLRSAFFKYLQERYGVGPEKAYLSHAANQAALFAQKALSHLGICPGEYNRLFFMKDLDLPFLMWIWSAGILSRHLAGQIADYFPQARFSR